MTVYKRRYLGPTIAHLLPESVNLDETPYAGALCGVSPEWPDAWYGSTSQDDGDTPARLPVCRRCNRAQKDAEKAAGK
jgi:hypothetical protein